MTRPDRDASCRQLIGSVAGPAEFESLFVIGSEFFVYNVRAHPQPLTALDITAVG